MSVYKDFKPHKNEKGADAMTDLQLDNIDEFDEIEAAESELKQLKRKTHANMFKGILILMGALLVSIIIGVAVLHPELLQHMIGD